MKEDETETAGPEPGAVPEPSLEALEATLREDYDAVKETIRLMRPVDRAVLAFHLHQLDSIIDDVNLGDRRW